MIKERFVYTWNHARAIARARWYFRKATHLGQRVRVWGTPFVENNGRLIVHDLACFSSVIATTEIKTEAGAVLEIGESTYVNHGCSLVATQSIRIGARCLIGFYATIMDNDFHQLDPDQRYTRPPSAPVVLEDNVWLGARAIVLPGVTIGADSVVGAGSVVTRDIPPRSLAVGVPARVIRTLG